MKQKNDAPHAKAWGISIDLSVYKSKICSLVLKRKKTSLYPRAKARWSYAKINKRIATLITTVIFVATTMAFPFQKAYAFNLFRELGNFLKHTTRFVVTLPDKATRWMGPVLGPAASFLITKNILKNPKIAKIFRTAQKTNKIIENIEEVKSHVNQLKTAYKDEASKLRKQADDLEKFRKSLAQGLLKGEDFDEYKDKVADIQRVIEAQRAAADQLDKQAHDLNTEKFVQMLGNKFIKNTVGDIRDIVLTNVASDLLKTNNPELIKKFVESEGSFDSILDFMVQRELYGLETDKTFDMDALKDRIKDRIKDRLDENKDYLKDNWKEELQALIRENYDQMREEAADLSAQGNEMYEDQENADSPEMTDEQEQLMEEFSEIMLEEMDNYTEKDFADCPNGYVFKRNSGRGCVQINCNEANEASHYSYTGDCICGSAGSINENPEDANVGCYFPKGYKSCPGCLYACIHAGDDCPLDGIAIY